MKRNSGETFLAVFYKGVNGTLAKRENGAPAKGENGTLAKGRKRRPRKGMIGAPPGLLFTPDILFDGQADLDIALFFRCADGPPMQHRNEGRVCKPIPRRGQPLGDHAAGHLFVLRNGPLAAAGLKHRTDRGRQVELS